MPAPPATRALLRQSRLLLRRQNVRQASTTAETAAKAKDAAGETTSKAKDLASTTVSKASEGLSRVTSTGGPIISGVASRATNALNSVGGRTGRAIAFVRDCESQTRLGEGHGTNSPISINTPHYLLLASRIGTLQDRLPRPENGSTVSTIGGDRMG